MTISHKISYTRRLYAVTVELETHTAMYTVETMQLDNGAPPFVSSVSRIHPKHGPTTTQKKEARKRIDEYFKTGYPC